MFKMIRVGSDFRLVILVTPPEAAQNLDLPGTKYYRYADWEMDSLNPRNQFNEVSFLEAFSYFSGNADGLGSETIPKDTFPSIEAATKFVNEKRSECTKAKFARLESLRKIT